MTGPFNHDGYLNTFRMIHIVSLEQSPSGIYYWSQIIDPIYYAR